MPHFYLGKGNQSLARPGFLSWARKPGHVAPPETRETRGAAHGHSTVLFGLVGQASDYTLAKVTFTGDSAAGHASLVTIAAEALGVPTPSELGAGGELNVRADRL